MFHGLFQKAFDSISHGFAYRTLSYLMEVMNRHIKISKNYSVVVNNHRMTGGSLDRVIAIFLWKWGFLENFETSLVKEVVTNNMTVLDIGANVGYYSLIFADLVGKEGLVYAFEPDPDNYAALVSNIRDNGCRNVVAVNKAVTDENKRLYLYRNPGNRGDHRIHASDGQAKCRTEVSGVSLDDYFNAGTRINFIKMDIQGAEVGAFRGMDRLINDNPDLKVIVEITPERYRQAGYDLGLFLKKLTHGYGFQLNMIDERKKTVSPVNEDEIAGMCSKGRWVNLFLHR